MAMLAWALLLAGAAANQEAENGTPLARTKKQFSASNAPSITANSNGDVIVAVPDGSAFAVRRYGPAGVTVDTSPLVSVGALSSAINATESRTAAQFTLIEDTTAAAIDQATSNLRDQIDIEHSRSMSSMTEQVSTMREQINALMQSVQSIRDGVPSTECSEYNELPGGRALGQGTMAGAVRLLSCNNGSYLADGFSDVAICHSDGNWSDRKESRCITTATTPTPASELACCRVLYDQLVRFVYTDGRRVALHRPPRRLGFGGDRVQFNVPTSTQVLGVHGFDDGGCMVGHFLMSCSTPSGSPAAWNFHTPGGGENPSGIGNGRGGNSYAYSRRWTARWIFQSGYTPPAGGEGAWARRGYDLNANGFGAPGVRYRGTSAAEENIFANNSLFEPFDECAVPDIDSHLEADTLGKLCVGPYVNGDYRRNGEQFFRYDTTVDP